MSPAVNESVTGARRESSRLDVDDQFHCKECGISLPWQVVIIGEFERCRECEKEEMLRQFRLDYPVEWAEPDPVEVTEEYINE